MVTNSNIPRHIAIIMDGNGRWAKQQNLSRVLGHKAGVESVREITQLCCELGVEVLSLFAFSSENWRRPKTEINALMEIFLTALQKEVKTLAEKNIQLRFIGDRTQFSIRLNQLMHQAETLTQENTGLRLVIAMNYGGRWDLVQAARTITQEVQAGIIKTNEINEESFGKKLALSELPEPDLFIRTSGEKRISNFFLWQLAYTELFFSDLYWPDFRADALREALLSYANRQRRFGCTGEQVEKQCLESE